MIDDKQVNDIISSLSHPVSKNKETESYPEIPPTFLYESQFIAFSSLPVSFLCEQQRCEEGNFGLKNNPCGNLCSQGLLNLIFCFL